MKSKILSILTIIFLWTMAIGFLPKNCSAQSYENKEITLHGTFVRFFNGEDIEQEGLFNSVVILDDNHILWGKVESESFDFEDIVMSPLGMYSVTEAFSFNMEYMGKCISLDGDDFFFDVDFGKKRFALMRSGSERLTMISFKEYRIIDK